MPRSLVSILLLALTACAPQEELLPGAGPSALGGEKIYAGSAPTEVYHDAVVGLHELTRRGVYTQPFCSGTLIGEDWIMTAAHCAVSRGRTKKANTFGIYVGDDPSLDLVSHLYYVDAVYVHASYSGTSLTNDIALLHLSTGITEVSPVAYLPSAEALTSADVGVTYLNHAGFGYDETRSYGDKLQVDVLLGGFGCTVTGCGSAGVAATQISYSQDNGATGIGPCNGDSGGPAFVTRASGTYVAGITSYGDSGCDVYGVSTRVDAFGTWINGYTGL